MVIPIGEFIKFFRKRAKMSQTALAEIMEITSKGLGKIESSASSPRVYTIKLFENHFKVNLGRYYRSQEDALPLASFECMWEMLMCIMRDNHVQAFKLACLYEGDEYIKNNEFHLNINYAKARFYAATADSHQEAIKYYKRGLKYEDYVHFDEDTQVLTIESFLPSVEALQLLINMANSMKMLGQIGTAIQIANECYNALRKFISMPLLVHYFYDKFDIMVPYSLFENFLAELYYEERRFNDALNIVSESIQNQRAFGALHLNEKYLIMFKSLAALGRTSEALAILPDVLFYAQKLPDEEVLSSMQIALSAEFPAITKQIAAICTMFNTMTTMYLGNI